MCNPDHLENCKLATVCHPLLLPDLLSDATTQYYNFTHTENTQYFGGKNRYIRHLQSNMPVFNKFLDPLVSSANTWKIIFQVTVR
jgi:hypothetical protein